VSTLKEGRESEALLKILRTVGQNFVLRSRSREESAFALACDVLFDRWTLMSLLTKFDLLNVYFLRRLLES